MAPISGKFENGKAWLSSLATAYPRVLCIGYGMPPCVSENIADAMRADEMVVVVVNCDDVVPRLSRLNTLKMAVELRSTDAPIQKWKAEDMVSYERYAKSYGKAQEFDFDSEQQVAPVQSKDDMTKSIPIAAASSVTSNSGNLKVVQAQAVPSVAASSVLNQGEVGEMSYDKGAAAELVRDCYIFLFLLFLFYE